MTSYVVLDAGFVFKSLIPNPQRTQILQMLLQWKQERRVFCAPSLWLYELTSILTKMTHFDELTEQDAQDSLAAGLDLGVELIVPDAEQTKKAFLWTRRLKRVAAYDSFYLALAESLGCDLWTVDKKLVNAAGQTWVKLVA
jgi:predicted nucleic acid-binding protein